LTDAGDKPVLEPAPGETPLWPEVRITGLFAANANFDDLRVDLKATLGIEALPQHEISDLEDRDWEREWLKDFGPMKFGSRLWIRPGDTEVDDEDAVLVQLDPGLAFGTGTHPTTALCLEWLDGLDLEGTSMLDYGCGSGVLAIAALSLGSDHAIAMDIDDQAIRATVDNALRNDVRDRMTVSNHPRGVAGKFDVVVANILAGPLIELAESIAAHVKGGCVLALSGILSEQVEEVLTAYRPWIEFEEPEFREQDGQTWARLNGRRTED
jgi:ribosomal protein L11 methyltransferase